MKSSRSFLNRPFRLRKSSQRFSGSNISHTSKSKIQPHNRKNSTLDKQPPSMAPDSFLHLARPLGPASIGTQSTAPINVVVQPQAIFSILDHSLRRNKDQERVIGTLLGVRSEDGTEIEIRNCYAVPHTETAEQVEVDMDYQKQMLQLHLRANPREVLVGWYATAAELNTFSALIQNFYGQQGDGTWPHPAVHLTVSTVPGKDIEARTYISAPIGVTADRAADTALFIPVPHEIKYGEAEKSGLELISAAKNKEDRSQVILTDIEALEQAIESVLEMLERVSNYVNNVLDEETPPSSALGQFLMNTLSLAPKVNAADIERDLYVTVEILGQTEANMLQQQPHPRRPGRLISCQHYSHSNRSIQSSRNSSIDYGYWRCPRHCSFRRRRGWRKSKESRSAETWRSRRTGRTRWWTRRSGTA